MNLALFDFDGTITNKDTFTAFLHFAVTKKKLFWGRVILSPLVLGHKAGIISTAKLREAASEFAFKGRNLSDLYLTGNQYSIDIIPKHLRPNAMNRIQWHKDQGDQIVVVSASLEVYLNSWCKTHELDLICSKFETYNGLITGKYNPTDCSGEEKARRIRKKFDLNEFHTIYAYGDTSEDIAMLSLADIKYYRWKEISG